MAKRKIEIKINKDRQQTWDNLLEMLINQNRVGFYIPEDGDEVYIYGIGGDTGWSLRLNRSGNWNLE